MPPAKTKAPPQSAADRALSKFQADMDKTYGAGTFQIGVEPSKYEVISTGSLDLDRRLVVGGYVRGRINEIWGPEGAGKTTLAILGMVEAQKAFPDLLVAFIDVERRHDKKWMRDHGLDLKRTFIVEPGNAEDVADMVKDMCRRGIFSMIVVDSIGAMIPEVEKQKDAGDAVVGKQASIVTRMVKIAAPTAADSKTVVLLLNQVRAAIGAYGQDTTTGGGHALKHATTMKLQVRRTSGGAIKVGSGTSAQQVGHMVTVKVERNSVALAYQTAQFTLLYVTTHKFGQMGVDWADEAARVGIEMGIIDQKGGWYTNLLTGERVQGQEAVINMLRSDKASALAIRAKAIEMLEDSVIDDHGGAAGDESPDVPTFGETVADGE